MSKLQLPVAILCLLGAFATHSACSQDLPKLRALNEVKSFAFALGDALDDTAAARLGIFDLVVIDGELASSQLISALHTSGTLVLGYLSVGTIERGRSWYRRVRSFRLDFWEDFGEWYANVAARRYRQILLTEVLPPILDKGFDGLFLDNIDMVETHTELRRGMKALVKAIHNTVTADGKLLFAQNGDSIIGSYLSYLDGWNREDVSFTYDFTRRRYRAVGARQTGQALRAIAHLRSAGIFVTTTDYSEDGDASSEATALAVACGAGALPFVTDIAVRRIPATPFVCPDDQRRRRESRPP